MITTPMWSTVISRRQRRCAAAALAFLLAFAGVATAAHACAIQNPASATVGPLAHSDAAMGGDCAEMAKAFEAPASLCEAHCVVGQQVDVQPAAPAAHVAAQQPLRIDEPDRGTTATAATPILLSTIEAAPPPLLRFARFLI